MTLAPGWLECSLLSFSGALSAVSDWRVMMGSWRVAACVLGCACGRFQASGIFIPFMIMLTRALLLHKR